MVLVFTISSVCPFLLKIYLGLNLQIMGVTEHEKFVRR